MGEAKRIQQAFRKGIHLPRSVVHQRHERMEEQRRRPLINLAKEVDPEITLNIQPDTITEREAILRSIYGESNG